MQTDAATHNTVSPSMLDVVGTCCVVHANERNNCQHCWWSSKEAMHSDTVILKKDCNAHTKTFSWGIAASQHCCGSMQKGATLLRYASPDTKKIEKLGLVVPKVWWFQIKRNKCQQMPTLLWFRVRPNNVACCWPTMLRPFAWVNVLHVVLYFACNVG